MDPVTHGVIGLAISAFQGEAVSLSNPASIGCALGAMSPDIDVVVRLIWDDYHYLKHHRGFSHSIPALLGLSGIITYGLSMIYPNFEFFNVFLWTFIGAFSHTFFDILNSYGAKLLAPFTNKKLKASILMLYDPVVTILCLFLIFKRDITQGILVGVLMTFILYLGIRYWMRKRAEKHITNHYKDGYKIRKINVLPSIIAFHKWTFVVEANSHNIVGEINIFNKRITVREKLKKPDKEFLNLFLNTNVGKYFSEFSPCFHIIPFEEMGKLVLKSVDLRYYFKDNFMHHATAVFDKDNNIIESFLHPYDINKSIYIMEKS